MYTSSTTIAAAALGLLSALPTVRAGLYLKSSPVVQIDAKNYDRLVAKSNYTTALEFYAPWCGHCQSLKPAYEKAAKNLDGLAKIAAVNCDEDENKALCGQFGVQGFPTIKIVRPGKKAGKPVVEDYQGPRTAKGIVDIVVDKINNHVKKVTDKDLDSFLEKDNNTAKAVLFTEKGTTGALLKSIAIDFLGVIQVAQIRNKESKAVETFGIQSYPSLLLLPGGEQPAVLYDGDMKKEGMVKFLSQGGAPNQDPAPEKSKAKKEKKDKLKASEAKSKTTTSDKSATTESVETPTEAKAAEVAPPIPAFTEAAKITEECLNSKSGTCILALVPSEHGEQAEKALGSLSEIAFKHTHGQRRIFPFFEVHTEDAGVASLLKSLDLTGQVEIIAVNGKRGWWRHFEGDLTGKNIEAWIDAIRLGEGVKKKLPEGVATEVVEEKPAETVEVKIEEEIKIEIPEPESESTSWQGAEPTPEATEAPEHDRDEL
ncbi:hypothetical protein BJ170DRAFT_582905 [Xylariales sp. AK1849]|nr:hypothetical protein BJ170DRAFT_582905 [Xylariales sp. AK1849]